MNLVATVSSQDMVTLTWDVDQSGVQDEFQLNYRADNVGFGQWQTSSKPSATISSLIPGQNYIFAVRVKSKDKFSLVQSTNVTLCK